MMYKKHNTFTRTPVFTQIIAYLIVIASFVIFTVSIQPNLANLQSKVTIMVFYYLSFLGIFITTCITSCTDPTDHSLAKSKEIPRQQNHTNVFYCQLCKRVVGEKTRHCKVCDTCVSEFDHHCIWINNCIGKQNYKIFISMLFCVDINFIVFQISILILWVGNEWKFYLGKMVTNWVFGLIVLIFLILLLSLTIFHIFLICKGRTTYQHILLFRKLEVVPETKQKNQKENNRNQNPIYGVDKLITFKTQTQLGTAAISSEQQLSKKVNDMMIFQAESKQQNSQIESKMQEKAQQLSQKAVSKKNKQENENSYCQFDSRIFIRSKSITYICGQFNSEQPFRIAYRSEIMKQQRLKIHFMQKKKQQK